MIRELTERQTYPAWAWIDCYELDRHGDATQKRQLYVMPARLRPVHVPPVPYPARRPAPRPAPGPSGRPGERRRVACRPPGVAGPAEAGGRHRRFTDWVPASR
ncbi:hypothetical protein D2L64_06530 [Micromonospora radicis]|uniref:Uncharacterized protein n=1 Tax=Micromonospora radicis TaxID=1894971 RepID=A0A418MZ14_9ACTN|nr:hypothetical protein D2L64_06530 [Micromonospora radicis]